MDDQSTFDQTDFFFTCLGILNSPDATLDDYLLVAKSLKVDLSARFTWRPRPDQPEKYDQQTAFYNSDSRGVIWLLGGNGAGTTETTMAKVAKLVRTIPAPRRDTPFWIIAGSYDQSMNTCWKEKLYGHGHITDEQIDWARVEWYRPKSQLPFKVPLLPQPCQKDKALFRKHVPEKFPYAPAGNWCLEFKSWRQGDHQMMAQSIGGFAFVEQFPWDVFTETMRGCREYFLPGSMLVEYTPVDPDLSGDIEAMIQGGPEPEKKEDCRPGVKYLPRGWEVYHANTECALEAGHVAKEWFDQYFGMIPSESRDMRLKGLFASFEGVIYKTFDPTVHVVGDEIFEWIANQNCFHRRALDWGAGPHNAFAALWGAKNHFNQWFVYDEYYSVDQEATVIDHLVNISQQQFWPENHPLYGTTYVDPARPDNIRLAQQLAMQIKRYGTGDEKEQVKNMNITLARNSVFEGIEHVQWLLKKSVPEWNEFAGADGNGGMVMRPRIFIHHSCTNLIRELKKYRWIKQTGIGKTENPVSARPEPLKLDDHCCFVGETLVTMVDGSKKRIDQVRKGEFVLSHLGIAVVEESACTGIRETVQIVHEFGKTRCTSEHPFYHYESRSFERLSELDVTCKLQDGSPDLVKLLKQWNGADSLGEDTPETKVIRSGVTSGGHPEKAANTRNSFISGFTRKSGNPFMARFQTATTFIIRTMIKEITRSKTLRRLPNQIMPKFIATTSEKRLNSQRTGIGVMTAGSGIQIMRRKSTLVGSQKFWFASSAAKSSRRRTQKSRRDFAATNAGHTLERKEVATTLTASAAFAEGRLESTNTRRLLPVQMPVCESVVLKVLKEDGVEPVFNLKTSDGTFFADGLLTSNCDALRYLTFTDDSKCGLTIESIKKQSKAAQTVHGKSGQNMNWRDIISNHGELAGVGERYGRTTAGKRRGNSGSDVTSMEHGQD